VRKLSPAEEEFTRLLPFARRGIHYIDARLGILAASMPLRLMPDMPALAATRPDLSFCVNAERFAAKTLGWADSKKHLGVMLMVLHEQGHHTLGFWRRLSMGNYDSRIFNYAQDIVLAQMLEAICPALSEIHDEWELLTARSFGFPEGLSTQQYYALLIQDEEQNGQRVGEMGSCASPEGEGEGSPSNEQDEEPGVPKAQSDKLLADAQKALGILAEKASKNRGYDPAGFKIDLELVNLDHQVSWEEELREQIGYALTQTRGSTHNNWAMSSRRQSGVGYGYGKPVIPATTSYAPSVAIVIDTSGSMMNWLAEAATHAWTLVQHCRSVRVLSCDSNVHVDVQVRSQDELLEAMRGGGGTNMEPAFRRLQADPDPPDVVVCITDGEIGDPGREPDWYHIWLTDNPRWTPLWGKHLSVPTKEDK